MSTITIAVISDLHCRANVSGANYVTRLYSNLPRKDDKHPVSALKKVIKNDKLKADILLCPGDITDKSDSQGFLSGWDYLKDIKNSFEARSLYATLGNHDVNSHGNSNPFQFAQQLENNYPFDDELANTEFWGNNFCVIEDEDLLLLVFNSSYSHTNEEASRKSSINEVIIQQMDTKLKTVESNKKYKIAMCHHHPINHYNKDSIDSDIIDKGDLFIEMLNKHGFQILIHGHKHEPRLSTHNTLPILASGSFSALTNLLDVGAENIFHLITLEEKKSYGTIKSYIYKPRRGWIIGANTSFPCLTGFGFYGDINELADKCNKFLVDTEKDFTTYDALTQAIPDVKYLTPDRQNSLEKVLIDEYKLELIPDFSAIPKKLIKQQL